MPFIGGGQYEYDLVLFCGLNSKQNKIASQCQYQKGHHLQSLCKKREDTQ